MIACSNGPDIASLVYQATSQIPRGMVSTYGDIAVALGDPVAARAVGEILSRNPTPIAVPCHRVIYSDGRTGWYGGHGQGAERKIELLRAEGIKVEKGMVVDLPKVRFSKFDIPPVLHALKEEQEAIRKSVVEQDRFDDLGRIAGLDISYTGERAFAALTIYDWQTGELVDERTAESVANFPYIPTYLSYREIPALRPLIRKEKDIVYLIDGQGVLHPRGGGDSVPHRGLSRRPHNRGGQELPHRPRSRRGRFTNTGRRHEERLPVGPGEERVLRLHRPPCFAGHRSGGVPPIPGERCPSALAPSP